jgi:hypothetical protein
MYFFYQRNFANKWVPCKTPDQPSAKSANGGKRELTPAVKLTDTLKHLDLASLMKLYPPPEDPEPAHVDFGNKPAPIVDSQVVGVVREYQEVEVQEGMVGR